MTSTHAWFVKTKTGIAGPFTPGQLKGFADSEKLPKSALVSKQADGPWVAAEQIRGLFDPPNDRVVEEEQIGPADLVPDAVKKSAAVVGNVMTGLSKNVVSSLKNAASNLSAKIESATTSVSAYCVDGQDPSVVEKMIHRVREICTNDEEILYVAMQAKPIANFSPDCVVISNKRFIIFRPKMLGRVTFYDCLWKESKDVHLKENILGLRFLLSQNPVMSKRSITCLKLRQGTYTGSANRWKKTRLRCGASSTLKHFKQARIKP